MSPSKVEGFIVSDKNYKLDNAEVRKELEAQATEILRRSSDQSKKDRPVVTPHMKREIKRWESQFYLSIDKFLEEKGIGRVHSKGSPIFSYGHAER